MALKSLGCCRKTAEAGTAESFSKPVEFLEVVMSQGPSQHHPGFPGTLEDAPGTSDSW